MVNGSSIVDTGSGLFLIANTNPATTRVYPTPGILHHRLSWLLIVVLYPWGIPSLTYTTCMSILTSFHIDEKHRAVSIPIQWQLENCALWFDPSHQPSTNRGPSILDGNHPQQVSTSLHTIKKYSNHYPLSPLSNSNHYPYYHNKYYPLS